MDLNQLSKATGDGETLWSLLTDAADAKKCRECGTTNCSRRPGVPYCSLPVSLPYKGTSGWSGTDTSEERAIKSDTTGDTKRRQSQTIGHLFLTRNVGLTWRELADMTGWHHGQASGVLSVMHKAGKICRLLEKRNRCRVYVLPEYVDGRETDDQGRKHTCPDCGHRF